MAAAVGVEAWRAEIDGAGCLPKPFDLDDLSALVMRYRGRGASLP